jgi:hypothetical protein
MPSVATWLGALANAEAPEPSPQQARTHIEVTVHLPNVVN